MMPLRGDAGPGLKVRGGRQGSKRPLYSRVDNRGSDVAVCVCVCLWSRLYWCLYAGAPFGRLLWLFWSANSYMVMLSYCICAGVLCVCVCVLAPACVFWQCWSDYCRGCYCFSSWGHPDRTVRTVCVFVPASECWGYSVCMQNQSDLCTSV
ncbi:hypothetical protein AALO_G00091170 [Alosa alosa]|uniref:Uncharacterized protein n=1 Tax=Alosa alosa TaxID=278164 RepID=A0AAV6GRJ2_9TELE|nr:hypothetical protein AALO_G00091170 [Alosa alosa]